MDIDNDLPVDRNSASLRAQVFRKLHAAITSRRFQPGQRLVERELCQMMGVSRPLIREVVRQLEAEGLVTVTPYRGPTVATLTPEVAEEVYKVRGVLEALASQLYAERADPAAKQRLRASFEDLALAYESRDTTTILDKKAIFYDTLLRGSGNNTAYLMLKQLHARVTVLRATSLSQPERLDASIAEVRRIVEAIEAGDAAAAWKRTIEHIEAASEAAMKILRPAETAGSTLQ